LGIMKKICSLLICFVVSGFAFGQKNESFLTDAYVVKGSWMLGGDLSSSWKSYSKDQGAIKNMDKGRIFRLDMRGKIGYFLLEDFGLGLKAQGSHLNLKSDSTGLAPRQTVVTAGPFLRKYFKEGIFGEAGAGMGLDHLSGGLQWDILAADLGMGFTYFLNNNIAVEPILALVYSRQKAGTQTQVSHTQIGPEFRLGIQAFLFKPRIATPEGRKPGN
jgi:hypothetical protein